MSTFFSRLFPPHNIRKILLFFSILTLVLIVVVTTSNFYFLYRGISSYQREIVFSELKKKALILSSILELDSYEKLLKSDIKIESDEYQRIVSPLRKAHFSIEGLRYVYTVYQASESRQDKILFGLDTALMIDADKDGVMDHSDFRSEYVDAPQEIKIAYTTKKVSFTPAPYKDKYGTFISVFVPLLNARGEVFSVLGVDMLYTHYQEILDSYKTLILKIYLICIFLVLVFVVILYLFYNKISQYKIQEAMLKNEIKDQQNFFIQDSKMAEIGKMVAGITHEINNPLTIIKGLSDQGLRKLDRDQMSVESHKKHYESIKNSTDRIIEVIRNMKSIVSRPIGIDDFYYFSASESMKNTLKAIKYKSASEKVTFNIHIDKGVMIYGNRSLLEQVFFNLISNAVDAIASIPKPWITIDLKLDDKFFYLHFIDCGHSLTKEMYRKISQGFYSSKAAGEGSGMGLMISKKIISMHEGELIFEEDKTTHFIVKLPKSEVRYNKTEESFESFDL